MSSHFALQTNKNLIFIKNLIIENNDILIDIKIEGSHERIPSIFNNISYTLIKQGKTYIFEFRNPVNYLHFKITSQGKNINELIYSFTPADLYNEIDAITFLKTKNIALLGCARNCEENLPKSLEKLIEIGELFNNYQIFIFHNDSDDGTMNILEKYKNNYNNFIYFNYENLDQIFTKRTERLSYCRNYLAQYALQNSNANYFGIVDLDGVVNQNLTMSSFISNFKYEKCWDACFPINNGIYYDLWALRHPILLPHDYSTIMNRLDFSMGESNAKKFGYQNLYTLNFSELSGFLEVESAFGGFGLYKKEAFIEGNYSGILNNTEICEHVHFNQCLKRKDFKLYINPEFIVNGVN